MYSRLDCVYCQSGRKTSSSKNIQFQKRQNMLYQRRRSGVRAFVRFVPVCGAILLWIVGSQFVPDLETRPVDRQAGIRHDDEDQH